MMKLSIVPLLVLSYVGWCKSHATTGGYWQLLLENTGVSAMHMALTHENTVLIFDQTEAGPSQYPLRHRRRCAMGTSEPSCYAHSIEYDIATNSLRPLTLKTDTWCSSGAFLSDGKLLQTGGYNDGYRKIRRFVPCTDRSCDWLESSDESLADNRWYATTVVLPEKDRVVVVGGRRAFSYEFVPKLHSDEGANSLPLLHHTNNRKEEGNNLYPFVHLSSDGNLFIFANRDSILLDYKKNKVVKTFPTIPGDGARNYPSSGSSVMLPLDYSDGYHKVEIMVCGGAAPGAYTAAKKDHDYVNALNTCGRIVITEDDPKWSMEEMPGPRVMNDMLVLPRGDVLILNGATRGAAGWENAIDPSLQPYMYNPDESEGRRFSVLRGTEIPRMYHSTAVLLPDGRILVAGSNPHVSYELNAAYPTELRMEAFTPYYMAEQFDDRRPVSLLLGHSADVAGVRHGEEFVVRFRLGGRMGSMGFSMYSPPFATHSFSMNQRLLTVECRRIEKGEEGVVMATLVAPPTAKVAPAGYYLITVVNGGVPSRAQWMRILLA